MLTNPQAAPLLYGALSQLLHEVIAAGFDSAEDYNWPKSIKDAREALREAERVRPRPADRGVAIMDHDDRPEELLCPHESHEYLKREKEFILRLLASLATENVDPERKPLEAVDDVAVDRAGGSSEFKGRPTSGGRRDGGERPATNS